ncbi:LLM class flavin-dependent oxidoreductase [Rhodococcus sp. NPDC004095]
MRFVVVDTPRVGGAAWTDRVKLFEDMGFHAVLVPDTLWTPSPFPVLAAAAAVTSRLRLRTWVAAAPLRTSAALVREVAALQSLSDARFELGIGAGRPDAEDEARRLAMPWGGATERIAQVEESAAAVRAGVDPAPEVVASAAGPRMLAAAGRVADRVALALGPATTLPELADAVIRARESCGPAMPFTLSLVGVGDRMPAWIGRDGLTADRIRATGGIGLLDADPHRAAQALSEHERRFGVDEVTVPGELADVFTPILTRLSR